MSILDVIQERLDALEVAFGPRWKVKPKRILLNPVDFKFFLDVLVEEWKRRHGLTDVEFGAIPTEGATHIGLGRPEIEFSVELR